jgi:hypothetical protein
MSVWRFVLAVGLMAPTSATCWGANFLGFTENGTLMGWDSTNAQKITTALMYPLDSNRVMSMDIDPGRPGLGPVLVNRYPDHLNLQRWGLNPLDLNTIDDVYLPAAQLAKLGASFGSDISAKTGRLRVVTNSGLNLDIEMNEFSAASATFNVLPEPIFAIGDVNEGVTPSISHIAYGLDGSGNEVLYGIVGATVVTFDPVDDATLHTIGALTSDVPGTSYSFGPTGGFDISSNNYAYLVAESSVAGGETIMFAFNPLTAHGTVVPVAGGEEVKAFAVVPEPGTLLLAGLGLVALGGAGLRRVK